MPMTNADVGMELGVSGRSVSNMARAAGMEPLHYIRVDGSRRLVPVFGDGAVDQLRHATGFGRIAEELGITIEQFAQLVLKHYPGGQLAVPRFARPPSGD